jgi:uncharacterized protein with von Willebrand factor type A (vWA) domain
MDNPLSLAWRTPDSVWKGMLRQDFRSWLDVQGEEVIREAETSTGFGSGLLREAFLGLYVPSAPLLDPPPEHMGHLGSIFRRAEEMPEWKGLRQVTGEDDSASAIGAAAFAKEMYGRLPPEVQEKVREAEEKNREAQERAREAGELRDLMEQLPKGTPCRPDVKPQVREKEKEARQAKAAADQANAALEGALRKRGAQVQRAIAEASRAGSGEVREVQEAARALGGTGWDAGQGAGGRQSMGALQKVSAFLKQSESLRRMLRELGWAKRAVSEQVRQSKHGRAYFTHFQTRELDFETISPDELTGLVMPKGHPARLDFLRKAGDDELLHRKFSGEEKLGRGPLVRVRDTSGSMAGGPHALQSAFDLALTRQMHKEGRRVVWITFSGAGQFDVWEPGKNIPLETLIEKLEFGYWGGTEPYGPLRKAIDIIRRDPALKRGDILITTDGIFATPPEEFQHELAEARKEPGLRLAALVIAGEPGAAGFADSVHVVRDLLAEREKLAEALGEVL